MHGDVNEEANHEYAIGVNRQWGRRVQRECVLDESRNLLRHHLLLPCSDKVARMMEEDVADPKVMCGGELEGRPLDVLVYPQQTVGEPKDGLQIRVGFWIAQRQSDVSLPEGRHDLIAPFSVAAGLDENVTEGSGREVSHVSQSRDESRLPVNEFERLEENFVAPSQQKRVVPRAPGHPEYGPEDDGRGVIIERTVEHPLNPFRSQWGEFLSQDRLEKRFLRIEVGYRLSVAVRAAVPWRGLAVHGRWNEICFPFVRQAYNCRGPLAQIWEG